MRNSPQAGGKGKSYLSYSCDSCLTRQDSRQKYQGYRTARRSRKKTGGGNQDTTRWKNHGRGAIQKRYQRAAREAC